MIVVLSIAGSDPTGGAGIQGDLKTFAAHDVYGAAVVTAVTAQNSRGVHAIHAIPAAMVAEQIDAVFEEFEVRGVKTGMLATAEIVRVVTRALDRRPMIPLVVDPIVRASAGQVLNDSDAVAAMRDELFPRATLITPNIEEAELYSGVRIQSLDDMREASRRIAARGRGAAVVTGGHAEFAPATDVLCEEGLCEAFTGPSFPGASVHGAGCAFAAACTVWLAQGVPIPESVKRAKAYVARAIADAPPIGGARRPLRHAVPAATMV